MPTAFAATPLDRTSLPQHRLDIADRVRTNPLPWPGQFSPQLVAELLAAYAEPAMVILDPFVGSGTSLVEAARRGHAGQGNDLNPAAVILARVYELMNLTAAERIQTLEQLRSSLREALGPWAEPLWHVGTGDTVSRTDLEARLTRLWFQATDPYLRHLAAALVVLCDFHRQRLDVSVALRCWQRLERIVCALPEAPRSLAVHHADARALPIASASIDLILTSPPYINVHNYHQKFRRSVEALAWDVLPIARSEIGSNRRNRGNRFLTVIQYALDMTLALREMVRTTRPGARLILVLGRESTVRGTRFHNGELVANIAVQAVGLTLIQRQERVFRNRYGTRIYEDILHFQARSALPDEGQALAVARGIVTPMLAACRLQAPAAARQGLEEALERLPAIDPSPLPHPGILAPAPA